MVSLLQLRGRTVSSGKPIARLDSASRDASEFCGAAGGDDLVMA
jgi:hypothetical protein